MDATTEVGRRLASQSIRARARFFGGTGFDLALEAGHATIACMMLAPCSASSMLSAFASTRPMAGPLGIDDACARHRLAIAQWWSD
jgi:hypothetical protein